MAKKRLIVQVDPKQLEKEFRKAGLKPNRAGIRKLAAEIEKKVSKTK